MSIHSEAENQFIFDTFHDIAARSFWIGAKKVNSSWTWSDGTAWGSYTKWGGWGGPGSSPSGDGDCVEMTAEFTWDSESTWNDLPCAGLLDLPFVCQRPKTTSE